MATLTSRSPLTSGQPEPHPQRGPRWGWLLLPGSVLAGLLLWEALVRVNRYPAFILPLPGQVWNRFLTVLADGTLARHTQVTLSEVLAGLALGLVVA
ncbi:MAG: ABC transporter permease, partial [Anaerolineales bacterium]